LPISDFNWQSKIGNWQLLEARVGIERKWCFSPHQPVQSQLSQSQAHRLTGSEIDRKVRHSRTRRQVLQNSATTREKVRVDSFDGELLALLLALFLTPFLP
jgi:hypothetical protein